MKKNNGNNQLGGSKKRFILKLKRLRCKFMRHKIEVMHTYYNNNIVEGEYCSICKMYTPVDISPLPMTK